jgi:hypothetical protein
MLLPVACSGISWAYLGHEILGGFRNSMTSKNLHVHLQLSTVDKPSQLGIDQYLQEKKRPAEMVGEIIWLCLEVAGNVTC